EQSAQVIRHSLGDRRSIDQADLRVVSFAGAAPPGGPVPRDDRVGGREEHAFVTVRPLDDVRRASLVAMYLDDFPVTVAVALVASLDRQLVSDCSLHGLSPSPDS